MNQNFNAVKKLALTTFVLLWSLCSIAQVKMYKAGEIYQMGDFNYVKGKWLGLIQIDKNRIKTSAYTMASVDSIVVYDSLNYRKIVDAEYVDLGVFKFNLLHATNIEMQAKAAASIDLSQTVIRLEMDGQLKNLEEAGRLIERGSTQVRNGFMISIMGTFIGSMLAFYGPTQETQIAGSLIALGSNVWGLGLVIGGSGNVSAGGKMLRPSTTIYNR